MTRHVARQTDIHGGYSADAENVMALLGKVKEKYTEVISENARH